MAKVDLYSALQKDVQEKEKTSEIVSDASIVDSFLSDDNWSNVSEETEDYKEWLNKINSCSDDERKKLILTKLKEHISPEDGVCLDKIIEILKNSPSDNNDIITLEKKLKDEIPEINPLALFQYTMLLIGAGIIQVDNS